MRTKNRKQCCLKLIHINESKKSHPFVTTAISKKTRPSALGMSDPVIEDERIEDERGEGSEGDDEKR